MGAAKKQEPAQHTPGPWFVPPKSPLGAHLWIDTQDHGTVARVETGPEQLANARLIAAAPELLEALRLASARLHLLDDVGSANRPAHEAMLAQLRAAIAKARGEG